MNDEKRNEGEKKGRVKDGSGKEGTEKPLFEESSPS
jgi:hypothetical protein